MGTTFARSAFKHGIRKHQIEYVIRHCGLAFDDRHPGVDLQAGYGSLLLGDDEVGVALEVVVVEAGDGGMIVVHAMKLRRNYRALYERALACRT